MMAESPKSDDLLQLALETVRLMAEKEARRGRQVLEGTGEQVIDLSKMRMMKALLPKEGEAEE